MTTVVITQQQKSNTTRLSILGNVLALCIQEVNQTLINYHSGQCIWRLWVMFLLL